MTEENTTSQLKNRAVSCEFIKNSGGFAVKADRGHKEPRGKWDPKKNDKTKSDTLLIDLQHTTDNLGVHLHGDIVDVDVDGENPYLLPALEAFLPPCSHIWGRKSKPRSHRVYSLKSVGGKPFDPGEHPILRRLARIRNHENKSEVAVELRGGPQSRGEYSLLPGSVHPSGEDYEWENLERAKSSLTVTTIDKLLYALRMAGVVAVLAPYWQEGLRNDLVMALGGFLHRISKITQTINGEEGDLFTVTEDDAMRLLSTICTVSDDDPSDKTARIKTMKQTWKKAEAGEKVTGASTIAELTGDKGIVQKLYTLLSDSPDIGTLEEFTNRFVIWQGPGQVIDMDAVAKGAQKVTMTRPNFANSWGHKFVRFGEKRYMATEILFSMEATTRVAGLYFDPGGDKIVNTREGQKVNQWSGFEIEPYPGDVTDKDVAPFLHHLRTVICRDNPEVIDWVTQWIAHIFVKPNKKSKTALVLVGKPGAGKSLLGHMIINKIIGPAHSATTDSVERIVKDFNVLFGNKIFIQCDEAISNKQRALANRLKALITDEIQCLEPKFVDAYFTPNHSRQLFTSNDVEDAIFLNDGLDDRRYTIIEVSHEYKDDVKGYWEPYIEWLDDEENLAKIHKWLKGVEIDWSLISRPLNTDAKVVMQQRSMGPFDKWLAAMLDRQHPLDAKRHTYWFEAPVITSETEKWSAHQKGHAPVDRTEWPQFVQAAALVRDYNAFVKASHRNADMLDASQIGASLSARGLNCEGMPKQTKVDYTLDGSDRKVSERIRWRPFPSYGEIHEYLKKQYGVDYAETAEEFGTDETHEDPEF